MAALSHWQLPAFRLLHLEESFVLAVHESPTEIRFDMELVVNERHPRYRAPRPSPDGCDATHCYRKGRITFRNPSHVVWAQKKTELTVGGDSQGDLGKVDSLLLDGDVYKLRGPWGRLELTASSVDVDVW